MKYTIEFKRYDSEEGLLSEQETIERIKKVHYSKPSKKESKAFENANSWAKYAFENNGIYCVTFYEDGEPIICIHSDDHSFQLKYLIEDEEGGIRVYLELTFLKFYLDKLFDDIFEPYPNNKVFLNGITIYSRNRQETSKKTIIFDLQKGIMNSKEIIYSKTKDIYNRLESSSEVNLSHNYFDAPKNYLDYEHLFDYEKIFKPEYLDIPLNQKEYIYKDGTRYYKDEKGNLIEVN